MIQKIAVATCHTSLKWDSLNWQNWIYLVIINQEVVVGWCTSLINVNVSAKEHRSGLIWIVAAQDNEMFILGLLKEQRQEEKDRCGGKGASRLWSSCSWASLTVRITEVRNRKGSLVGDYNHHVWDILTITVDNFDCNKYSTLRSVMWSWEVLWWSWLGPTDHHSWQTFFATNSPCYEVSWVKYAIKLSKSVFISIIPSWKSKSDANMFCPLYWSPPLWQQPCCWNIMSGWHLQSVA